MQQLSPYVPNVYPLRNRATGLCAEVNNGTNRAGELVDEWYCNDSTAEQWVPHQRTVGGRTYLVRRHNDTALCLDTGGGQFSRMMKWGCLDDQGRFTNNAQTWRVH
jgi:hypothetical protein